MSAQQLLAVVRLIIVLAGIAVIFRNRCAPHNLLYSTPYLAWLVHAVIYLGAYLILSSIGAVNAVFFNVWGASLQIQGYMTVLLVEIARFYRQRSNRGGLGGC